jgi:hypothetical protein
MFPPYLDAPTVHRVRLSPFLPRIVQNKGRRSPFYSILAEFCTLARGKGLLAPVFEPVFVELFALVTLHGLRYSPPALGSA